jgi:hypothetical protein
MKPPIDMKEPIEIACVVGAGTSEVRLWSEQIECSIDDAYRILTLRTLRLAEAINKMTGAPEPPEPPEPARGFTCPRCQTFNEPGSACCKKCRFC